MPPAPATHTSHTAGTAAPCGFFSRFFFRVGWLKGGRGQSLTEVRGDGWPDPRREQRAPLSRAADAHQSWYLGSTVRPTSWPERKLSEAGFPEGAGGLGRHVGRQGKLD